MYDACMRTTIDLDPDLDATLRQRARERGASLRQVVNDAVRAGLGSAGGAATEPYVLPTCALGVRPSVDVDRALSLAADLEDTETLRKLELRK